VHATYGLALRGGVDELLTERLPVLIRRGLLNLDFAVVARQLEDDVLVFLGELEIVVGGYAVRRDRGTMDGAWTSASLVHLCVCYV
jgi:hypothetical protein